jgi:hypothetical protein
MAGRGVSMLGPGDDAGKDDHADNAHNEGSDETLR